MLSVLELDTAQRPAGAIGRARALIPSPPTYERKNQNRRETSFPNAVLLIYLNASPQSAALRGERPLQEFGIFVGGRSHHGCSKIHKLGRVFALDGLLLPRLPTGRGVGERHGP